VVPNVNPSVQPVEVDGCKPSALVTIFAMFGRNSGVIRDPEGGNLASSTSGRTTTQPW
jgi:hypothetical protein